YSLRGYLLPCIARSWLQRPASPSRSVSSGEASGSLIQERGVAPRGGGIDRQRALARKSSKIMRTAGFRARPRKPCPAERLHTDDGADHVSIDIGIADGGVGKYLAPKGFQPGLHTYRQAVVRGTNSGQTTVTLAGAISHDMQYRPEFLARELRGAL